MERMQLFINLYASVYLLKYQNNDMIFSISYFITFNVYSLFFFLKNNLIWI